MEIKFNTTDDELQFLGGMLHQAALYQAAKVAAYPNDIGMIEEIKIVEASGALADSVADLIAAIDTNSKAGLAVKERAAAWNNATYWNPRKD